MVRKVLLKRKVTKPSNHINESEIIMVAGGSVGLTRNPMPSQIILGQISLVAMGLLIHYIYLIS